VSFIVDNSVALSWYFDDERTEATRSLLFRITNEGAYAPGHWPLEALNGLLVAVKRGRMHKRNLVSSLRALSTLPITIDTETAARTWNATQMLAERFRLTAYDAAYLELAERLGLPLATLDQDLRAAGRGLGIALLGV
jgi:predicted nucleic acid-binding protein